MMMWLLTKDATKARAWVGSRRAGRGKVLPSGTGMAGNAKSKNSNPSWTAMILRRAKTLAEVYKANFLSSIFSAVPSRWEAPAPIASRILLAVSELVKHGVYLESPRTKPAVGKREAASIAANRHVAMTS